MSALKNKVITLLEGIIISVILTLIILAVWSKSVGTEPKALGYDLKIVFSRSMEPIIDYGSLMAIDPNRNKASFTAGEIIIFKDKQDQFITRRIVEVISKPDAFILPLGQVLYRTKADKNLETDKNLVLSNELVGSYTGVSISHAGSFIHYVNSDWGTILLVIFPMILFISSIIYLFWRNTGHKSMNLHV